MLDLCGNCRDPGSCCREIRLYFGNAILFGDTDDRLTAIANASRADVVLAYGVPFVPERFDADRELWVCSCPNLTPEGRCGDYENRPDVCRVFEPGVHWPCAMASLPPLPDPNDPVERSGMDDERASRDRLTREQRSRLMSRIRGKDTGPELAFRAALDRLGIAHETHARDLPGTPDVVLRGARLAVFVDGDFWHGRRFPAWRDSLTGFWRAKIERNMARDRRVRKELRAAGWAVLRFWEHQVKADALACARRTRDVSSRSTRP